MCYKKGKDEDSLEKTRASLEKVEKWFNTNVVEG